MTSETLLDRLLDPQVKVGMSTPKADPAGDYALELFGKADQLRPGAAKSLTDKALRLTGGPDSPPPPKERNVYGVLVEQGSADVFLTYCTNAVAAQKEVPALVIVQIPPALEVGADYGLIAIDRSAAGQAFAQYVLSPAGQDILLRHGFASSAVR